MSQSASEPGTPPGEASRAAPVLTVTDLAVQRGGRILLTDLSFRLAGGEALVLTGPNGAGKTSLLRTIAGYLHPSSGEILLLEADAPGMQESRHGGTEVGQRCHFIGHLDGLKAQLTVAENLSFWARFLDGDRPASAREEAVERAMAAFGVDALTDIPAAYLSAGQKRRLGLARLLVAKRPVWLLDEPSVSLDAASVDLLRAAIGRHLSARGIVIAATHLPLGIAAARTLELRPAAESIEADGSEAFA